MSRQPLESLDARSRRLLRALIAQYIQDGQPVGSRTLSKHAGIDLSPATIRNVLSDLENSGLLAAPHSSAGRVPTAQGYRLFIDSLIKIEPLNLLEIERLREEIPESGTTQDVLNAVGLVLSETTQFVGLVSVPNREHFGFKQIEFVPLSPTRVLVVIVFQDGEVQNRVIESERSLSRSELESASNYLNAQFSGLALRDVRARLVADLHQARTSMDQIMARAIEFAESAFAGPARADMLVAGQTKLMACNELGDMEKLRALFDAFAGKQQILGLLERSIHADGVNVFIGEESGYSPLGDCSLVTAPYKQDGRVLGVLGVIGPTRMAYDRVISVVAASASILTRVLSGSERAA